jgi:hypothetical protein
MPPRGNDLIERELTDQSSILSEHPTPGDGNSSHRGHPLNACLFEDIEELTMGDNASPAT